MRPVGFDGVTPLLTRMIQVADNRMVFLGALGSQPLLGEMDLDGVTRRQHILPEEGATAISAVLERNGSITVLAEEGIAPDVFTWIGRLNARGEITDKKALPGRPLDISALDDDGYVLLVEKMGRQGSDVLVKGLKPDFTESWTRVLMTGQPPVRFFRVAPVADGGFIVAGTKDRGIWVSCFSHNGGEIWTEWQDPRTSSDMEMASHVELASDGKTFVVAYTAFIVKGREQREVVRSLRFTR